MKTYENFITDLYYQRKFPKKVNQLADMIINFLRDLLPEVKILKKYDLEFGGRPIIKIQMKLHISDENLLSIKVYRKISQLSTKVEDVELVELVEFSLMQFLPNSKAYTEEGLDRVLLNNIYDFLKSIFEKYSKIPSKYKFDIITEDSLDDIIEEFKNVKDKFEFFVNTKNYNL